MSKAWNSSQIPNITQSFIGFKNKIINGDFSVWQRGESFTAAGYTADRFRFDTDTDDNIAISKVDNKTFNSYKISLTPGTTGTYNKVATRLEFPYKFSAKTFTLSFKIKASVTTNITVGNKFVIGETDTDDKNTTIALGTTFENKTYTFTNADVAAQAVDNSIDYFEIYFLFPVNTDVDIEIAEVQLEEGSVATEFEQIPYDIQLQRCMRYYEKFEVQLGSTRRDLADVRKEGIWFYKVDKRVVPTVTYDIQYISGGAVNVINNNIKSFYFYPDSSQAVILENLIADAEL